MQALRDATAAPELAGAGSAEEPPGAAATAAEAAMPVETEAMETEAAEKLARRQAALARLQEAERAEEARLVEAPAAATLSRKCSTCGKGNNEPFYCCGPPRRTGEVVECVR